MPGISDGVRVGRQAVASARQLTAERIINLLRRYEPGLLSGLTDVGVVNRDFVEDPVGQPLSSATPLEVAERTLSRILERRPSLLAKLGLSAVEVLSVGSEDGDVAGSTVCLTVGFTDLEGFTRFTAREGDGPAARLLAAHYRTAGPIVRSRGGRVVKRLGDGLLVTFPEPTAAVLAAVELVASPPEPLRVRAGLHQGEVLVHRGDVVGHVVNIAAKVTESAHGGEVLVSDELARALPVEELPSVRLGRLRRRRLKGVDARVAVRPVTVKTP